MVGRDFHDRRQGIAIRFFPENFPKLIGLLYLDPKTGKFQKAKADLIVSETAIDLSGGTYTLDKSRAETLLWLPDVIQDPDSIHENRHPIVMGDEVYVKRYAGRRSPFKLAFTTTRDSGVRVVTTSFWAGKNLERFLLLPPKWEKGKAAPKGGSSLPITPGPGDRSQTS